MGQASRSKPRHLAEKLLHIRNALQLSQNELIHHIGVGLGLTQARISAYERGVREPPLIILLEYARLANVYADVLIDDEVDLPSRLPANIKNEGIKRKSIPKGHKKSPSSS